MPDLVLLLFSLGFPLRVRTFPFCLCRAIVVEFLYILNKSIQGFPQAGDTVIAFSLSEFQKSGKPRSVIGLAFPWLPSLPVMSDSTFGRAESGRGS